MTSKDALGKLGDGFLLRLYDPRNVMHQGLLNYLVKINVFMLEVVKFKITDQEKFRCVFY